jgi:Fe-S-cluster containining protein
MHKGVHAEVSPVGLIAECVAESDAIQNFSIHTELSDCQRCAACCFSELARYVRVTGNDYARLGADAVAYVHFIENRAFMLMTEGHCAALKYESESLQFVCQVYEDRPEVCRELERGSTACKGEHQAKGERSLATLRRKTSRS